MRLHVHRSGDAFLEALASATGCSYVIFGRSGTDARLLTRGEAVSRERGHRDINDLREVRVHAETLLRHFFELAARSDPQWRYAYSSRVPLAIPDYAEVGLVFMLRALDAEEPETVVHALVADPWQAELVGFEAGDGPAPVFRAGRSRGLPRSLRSLARRVCAPRPRPECDVLVFTLGDAVSRGAPEVLAQWRARARAYVERYLIDPTPAHAERMAEVVARC